MPNVTIYNINEVMQDFFNDEKIKEEYDKSKAKVVFAKHILIDNYDCKKKNRYELECETFRMILHWEGEALGWTDDYRGFKSFCSTKNLDQIHLKNLYAAIADHAPEDLKRQCGYLSMQIVLASVFPIEYERDYKPFDAKDLFVCKGDLKASMIRNCKADLSVLMGEVKPVTDPNAHGKPSKVPMDDWLWGIIDTFLEQYQGIEPDRYDKKMETLCVLEKAYLRGELKSGMFEIIRERYCANTMIDYYMMFAPKDAKGRLLMPKTYQNEYINIRNRYFEPDPLITMLTNARNAYYKKEKQLDAEEVER